MAAVLWLIGGVLLVAAEALTGDFVLLMLGTAALGTAGFSALTDVPVWADGLVFAALAAVLVLGVRPVLRRRFARGPVVRMNVEALPGSTATVIDRVDGRGGTVRLDGQVWSARAADVAEAYAPGEQVTVVEIDGATAVVWRH